MVGASGAISGVLAAYVLLYPRARVTVVVPLGIIFYPLKISAIWVVGFWFAIQILSAVLTHGRPAGRGLVGPCRRFRRPGRPSRPCSNRRMSRFSARSGAGPGAEPGAGAILANPLKLFAVVPFRAAVPDGLARALLSSPVQQRQPVPKRRKAGPAQREDRSNGR